MVKNLIKYKAAKKVVAPVAGNGALSTVVAVKAVKKSNQRADERRKTNKEG